MVLMQLVPGFADHGNRYKNINPVNSNEVKKVMH